MSTSGVDGIRRTRSMPKRNYSDNRNPSKNSNDKAIKPAQKFVSQTPDCFFGFNRAKSRFFHSCRYSKSKQPIKDPQRESSASQDESIYNEFLQKRRSSTVSDTDTIVTNISCLDNDLTCTFNEPNSMETNQSGMTDGAFHLSLRGDLPVPIPPPRTFPPWPKHLRILQMQRQQQSSSQPKDAEKGNPESYSLSGEMALGSSVTDQDTSTLKQSYLIEDCNDFDSSDSFSNMRIYPVVQNGIKMSDTHYWILNPPKCSMRGRANRFLQSSFESSNMPRASFRGATDLSDDKLFNGRSNSLSTKLLTKDQYVNLPSFSQSLPGTVACTPTGRVGLHRGRSETSKEHLQNIQDSLVARLRQLIPTAKETECQAVLIGSSWNFEDAHKRLKLELLCRTGCASKPMCQRLLEKLGWNFEEAMNYVQSGKPIPHRRASRHYFTFDQSMLTETSNSRMLACSPSAFPSTCGNRSGFDVSPGSSTGGEVRTPEPSPDVSILGSSPFP